ncbi:MAG: hypothetical protein BMS9Abin05_1317 [Rhodothermia bacterium]|nr:MAG: hypothetical protein BMS9Abin05_1317 [Rhodothermia bacterium]
MTNGLTITLNSSRVVMNGYGGVIPTRNPVRISTARILMTLAVIGFLSQGSLFAQGFVDQMDALKGLEGVYIMGGDLDDELSLTGLQKEDVLAAVTKNLRNRGMPVLDETDWLLLEDSPVLHVDIVSSIDHESSTLYSIRLEVFFSMNKLSDPAFTTYAVAWGEGKVGVIDSSAADAILQDLGVLVERLVADYHAVNS